MTYQVPVIFDLASCDFENIDECGPPHPLLIELVDYLARISAEADWRSFMETGVFPYTDPNRKEGGDD